MLLHLQCMQFEISHVNSRNDLFKFTQASKQTHSNNLSDWDFKQKKHQNKLKK